MPSLADLAAPEYAAQYPVTFGGTTDFPAIDSPAPVKERGWTDARQNLTMPWDVDMI
jgi:hypothetical protein